MHVDWSATVSFETLRVFVVGKNYRVQNIQLSKIRLAGLCRQSVNVGHLSERHSRSAKRSVPTSVQERLESLITPPKLFKEPSLRKTPRRRDRSYSTKLFSPCCPPSLFRASAGNFSPTSPSETLVENTGLEPVTSWLQTRRSPS